MQNANAAFSWIDGRADEKMQGDARGEVRVEYENYTHQIGEKGEKE